MAVFALGVSCVVTQLVLMREMLGVFAGNELVLGVVLGNWLLLMGLGAALGRWLRPHEARVDPHPVPAAADGLGAGVEAGVVGLAGLLVLTALVPPAQIVVLRGLRSWVFLPGEAIGVVETVLASFVVLMPYCLAAGFGLALACRLRQEPDAAAGAGSVYVMDSLGSVAGGVLFSFVLVSRLDHVALSGVPAALNLVTAAWLAWNLRHGRKAASGFLAATVLFLGAGLGAWLGLANPDASSTARQFPAQRILFRGHSPYGRLVVTEAGGQTNFLQNGVVLASTPNLEASEETAHFALAQRPDARRVLLIGGTLSGAAREILRHRVGRLDSVELDPLVSAVGRRFLPAEFGDPRLRVVEDDARRFVRRAGAGYDVLVVALPDPATAQLNRFFTHEFFQETRRLLGSRGVLSFAVGRYENFAGPELAALLSCARQTAARSFAHVRLLPAGRVFFVASDAPLTVDIASALAGAGVATRWVNRGYLAGALAPDRLAGVERAASQPAPVNRDFAPALYDRHLGHWASQFQSRGRWLAVAFVAVTAVYIARLRGAACAIFASGFAGATLEIVLLLVMQVLAGAVYRQVAWVVTLFMAGLAAGAFAAARWRGAWVRASGEGSAAGALRGVRLALGLTAVGVAGLAVLVPAGLPVLGAGLALPAGEAVIQGILLLFTFSLASLVGAQFPLANRLAAAVPNAPARLFAADFAGAALGALLTSAWLLPVAGVAGTCWLAAALNVGAAGMVFWRTRAV
ncbi:MAG: fused MFS/spermidine synthase [Verrucomicrobia bacterium]|nr:fused MFS/spermidine synthase [Verrucomicrobiota bacterium]